MMHYGWYPSMGFWGGSFLGFALTILFWVFVALVIASLVRGWRNKEDEGTHESTKSALDILKKRYVKGEINKKEYEEIKKEIK